MTEMYNDGFFKITVKDPHKGEDFTLSLRWDADVIDWIDVFKKMLTCAGFHPNTVKEAFYDEDIEING